MKHIPFVESNYYHIFNRSNNNEKLFIERINYEYFLDLAKKYLLPIADIYSYCLLPNHFHFVLKLKDRKQLPQLFREGKSNLHQPFSNMFNTYAKAINKKYSRRGSLFQEHLKRVVIENENYLRNLIVYVNTNPDHHEIENFKNYPYSSYNALITEKFTLLKRNEVIELFEDKENFIYMHEKKKMNIDLLKDIVLE